MIKRSFLHLVFILLTVVIASYTDTTTLVRILAAESEQTHIETRAAQLKNPQIFALQQQDIKLLKQGFGQNGKEVGYGFIVENPNANLAIESSQYQIAAYDADGAVVKTDSGYLELLLPSQKVGVGGTMYLDEGVSISKIEVQLSSGRASPSDAVPTFTVDAVSYTAGQISAHATGIVSNPFNRDVNELRVSVVAYDSAGEIIGGGFTFLNFILANSKTGVKVSVDNLCN